METYLDQIFCENFICEEEEVCWRIIIILI